MSVATSLKLPAELKAQIDEVTHKADVTAHAYRGRALTDTARRAQKREQFDQDTMEALAEVKRTELAHSSSKQVGLHAR